jgi:hypothetical protein
LPIENVQLAISDLVSEGLWPRPAEALGSVFCQGFCDVLFVGFAAQVATADFTFPVL